MTSELGLSQELVAEAQMKRISRTSLSDEIVEQIIDLMSRGVLKPGDRLPAERELCKRFGVGRTSLREALRSLSVMGLLEGRVGEGTFVSGNDKYLEKALNLGLLLDGVKVQDLIETRLMLESQTAYLAAQRATGEDIDEIGGHLLGMESAVGELETYLISDVKFHLAVARATQNSILSSLLGMTRTSLQEWIKRSLTDTGPTGGELRAQLSLTEHRSILEAIRDGDADGAREAMIGHIRSSGGDLQAHFQAKARSHL
jgi:GntR family transcriptional repressor for pyruvate dehydrogenase complex